MPHQKSQNHNNIIKQFLGAAAISLFTLGMPSKTVSFFVLSYFAKRRLAKACESKQAIEARKLTQKPQDFNCVN